MNHSHKVQSKQTRTFRERVKENPKTTKYAKYVGLQVEAEEEQGRDEGEVIDTFQLQNKLQK